MNEWMNEWMNENKIFHERKVNWNKTKLNKYFILANHRGNISHFNLV